MYLEKRVGLLEGEGKHWLEAKPDRLAFLSTREFKFKQDRGLTLLQIRHSFAKGTKPPIYPTGEDP